VVAFSAKIDHQRCACYLSQLFTGPNRSVVLYQFMYYSLDHYIVIEYSCLGYSNKCKTSKQILFCRCLWQSSTS